MTVAGRSRSIHSIEFVTAEAPPGDALVAAPLDPDATTNALPTTGRLLLIVVDEANLRLGATRAVVHAAEGLLANLAPGDLVGLARLPEGGGLAFTTDRARLIAALEEVRGSPGRPTRFGKHVYLSEALDFAEASRDQWPRAVTRECGLPTDPTFRACRTSMELEARELLREESQKTTLTAGRLRELMRAFDGVSTPLTMVLISEGLFIGQDPGALAGLAAAGAAARVSLHVVRPVPPSFLPGQTGLPIDPSADDALRAAGLETLAARLRGGVPPDLRNGPDALRSHQS